MITRLTFVLATALALAGCGGGSTPANDVQTGTGSQPPQESVADISARLAGIISRTDSLVVSTWYGESSNSAFPTFRARSSCSGTTCTFLEEQSGLSISVSLDDLDLDTSRSNAILTKHGITVLDTRDSTNRNLAAAMNHSAFSILSNRDVLEGTTVWNRLSTAGGDLTRSRPSGTATWTGLMVGVPTGIAGRTDFLQGDAALTYDFAGSLDASFTGIRNITRNRAYSVTSVRFNDIPVSSNGTFQVGLTGNHIQGGLYGPGHAETAGVFEQKGIVGSFGAKR
ncbi:MAG: hypothetical protein OXF56_23350 [Rhodobacteraceae bacterium]|nr:hypothetical protein [Paracoccaceae bacterium]